MSVPSQSVKLVLEDGKVKEVLKRRGYGGNAGFVDWLNFTIGTETFNQDDCRISETQVLHDDDRLVPLTPEEFVVCISRKLKTIFGFGVSHDLHYGQHFYEHTYALAEGWGNVSLGGQNNTILISLSGTGLAAAKEGWELRLKTFLETAERSRITRVDLAHDDYTGETYSVNQADEEHTAGLFNCGGRNPRCEYRGDWKNPDGKGRSFYVGNRKNGKFCRVYEKGRELGCKESEWVRIEVEFKSVDRVIPFDVLTRPGEYLSAAYPAFNWITAHQERIQTTQKIVASGVESTCVWLRHQCGNAIHHLVELFGVEQFLAKVSRNDKTPLFVNVPHYGIAGEAFHERRFAPMPTDLYQASIDWFYENRFSPSPTNLNAA